MAGASGGSGGSAPYTRPEDAAHGRTGARPGHPQITHVRLADLPTLPDGEAAWTPVRHALHIAAFGVNAYTAQRSGAVVIEEHDESDSRHEELYVVLTGRAEFTIDGESFDAPPGTLVAIRDPDLQRVAHARQAQTTVLAVGGVAGEAFEPRDWEQRGAEAFEQS
jgi:mannose-6-phosphate isomerase-like protein (cupin superfamily)